MGRASIDSSGAMALPDITEPRLRKNAVKERAAKVIERASAANEERERDVKRKSKASSKAERPSRWREGFGVVFAAIGAYVLVSVVSYHPLDPSFNASGAAGTHVLNAGGIVGAYLADLLIQLLGLGSYVVVALFFATGGRLAFGKALAVKRDQGAAYAAALFSAAILLEITLRSVVIGGRAAAAGGVVGRVAGGFLVHWTNLTGAALFSGSVFVLAAVVITGGSVSAVLKASVRAGTKAVEAWKAEQERKKKEREEIAKAMARPRKKMVKPTREETSSGAIEIDAAEDDDDSSLDAAPGLLDIVRAGVDEEKEEAGVPADGPKIVAPVVWKPKPKKEEAKKEKLDIPPPAPGSYVLPDLALLVSEDQKPREVDAEALKANAEVLERKLKDFGVFGRVVEVHPGPVITMYEFEPAAGIKVNRVANLVDDLKMAMKATSVRIVAPIPGKGTVGIEIPNESRETVFLKDILGHAEYHERQTQTPIALGKDIAGKPIVADLSKMPHLLVAGTTGSGKSVSVNAMIMSLLYRSTPNDVRLIMIDPKMLEFSIYDGIPHLLLPVITNPKKASMALKWAVTEMERRYRLLADVNARNIVAYNKRIPKILEERQKEEVDQSTVNDPMDGQPSLEAQKELKEKLDHGHLPYIVIVIDELADLMLVAKNEVEESITRLAQMARAAGIHLLIATQRPSVDVITGLIKANFPARIAFRVFSKIDSRTVLDSGGAEALLGDGDMLFLPPATARLARVHGAFISDTEIQKVVDFLKSQGAPRYEEEILRAASAPEGGEGGAGDEEADELYDQAIAIVAETRQASISFLQRKLKVGYNRAARMIERMESEGIVGASDGVKPRPVLIQSIPAG